MFERRTPPLGVINIVDLAIERAPDGYSVKKRILFKGRLVIWHRHTIDRTDSVEWNFDEEDAEFEISISPKMFEFNLFSKGLLIKAPLKSVSRKEIERGELEISVKNGKSNSLTKIYFNR